ncbi:MAG: hypothetical protein D6712_16710 [Chloroflexi bacterium]|nr:MAG: hypothetical protein D6712_16710 [Chloroflexota bacterium]
MNAVRDYFLAAFVISSLISAFDARFNFVVLYYVLTVASYARSLDDFIRITAVLGVLVLFVGISRSVK